MKKNFSKKRSRLIKFTFFISVALYFLYEFISIFLLKGPITEIIQYGDLNFEKPYECIIIRQESIVKSPGEGSAKYFVEEGEKVEKGHKVAEIYTSSINTEDREKLKEINDRINDIQSQGSSLFDTDIDKLNSEITSLLNNIKKDKLKGNYSEISYLKEELKNKLNKKSRIKGNKSFSGYNLDSLKIQQEKLQEKINNSIIELYSPESGVVSYYIDGGEQVLSPNNVSKINFDYIESLEITSNKLKLDKVIYDQPVFKVIDNTSWYVGIITNTDESKTFKRNHEIYIDINNQKISGIIQDIINNTNDSLIIVKVDQQLEDFYKNRKMKLNIIKEQFNGLKIHKDSIIEKDGQLGVFVLDINKKAVFKPIKVVGYQEEVVIIKESSYLEKIGDETKRIGTVKLFDEVLRNGSKYSEGEIIY